jgi:hypothetical protein
MSQTINMKRLHQGCGESLQSNLLDLVMMKKPRWPKQVLAISPMKKRSRQDVDSQQEMRFWG